MEIKKLGLEGLFEISFNPIKDNRGFFMRTFDESLLKEQNINGNWVQENHAKSNKKGLIRGLHFQIPPYSDAKLFRCIKGAIFDVVVDLRKDSNTFGCWNGIELSEENNKMLFIPRDFAHGYCTLEDNCEVIYKVDNYYTPSSEMAIMWNDKDLNIKWPVSEPILSDKDSNNPSFREFKNTIKL